MVFASRSEPLLEIRIRGDVLGKDLDGDGAVQAGIKHLLDFSHAPSANRGEDLVRAELRPGFKRHGYGNGTRAFSSSNQFCTRTISFLVVDASSPASKSTVTNLDPSGAMSWFKGKVVLTLSGRPPPGGRVDQGRC